MGTGGISFRSLLGGAGAACVVLVAGCRSSREDDDLRSQLQVSTQDPARPSLVVGHRFGRWLEVDPDAAALPALESACLLDQTGAYEEAISVLTEALSETSACASLFEARGALYLSSGFPRAAAGDFQRAVGLTPKRVRAWYALGHAYEVLGLSRQALEALERARGLGGDDAELFLSLARVQRALGHAGRAAQQYEAALGRCAGPSTEILVEAAVLATEDAHRAASVETLRERLESCCGIQLSDDAWLLRALLRELPGEPPDRVGATLRALDVPPPELADLTRSLLTAVQLADADTSADARARLLAAEPDAQRRAMLERCIDLR